MPRVVHNKLTAAQVARTMKPGRYVFPKVKRRRELGLGSVKDYSLAEAREVAPRIPQGRARRA